MNIDVLLLFFNATLSMALAAIIVIGILRREYLPTIRRLEEEELQEAAASDSISERAPSDGL
jgi:hypothetical protein